MMSCLADLQAEDPSRNIARAYTIEFGQELPGAWILRFPWVCIGVQDYTQEIVAPPMKVGLRLLDACLRQRSLARNRIGVAYQPG